MSEIALRPLQPGDIVQLPRIVSGYATAETYAISKDDNDRESTFTLKLVSLPAPKTVIYDHLNEAELDRLASIVAEGLSVGAFLGGEMVGAAICSVEEWNQSLRVWEFHVAESRRGQGIGRRLMDKLVETAVAHGVRVIVCETQSSNVPAIRAYRKLGFILDGIDLSLYSNEDLLQQSVAVFMKKYLT